MKFDSFCYSTEPCDTVSEYLVPVWVAAAHLAENPESLLLDRERQPYIARGWNPKEHSDRCRLQKGGYVVLDMGAEIHGGAEITVESVIGGENNIRVVFGESVMEALSAPGEKNATNDHAPRDITVATSSFGRYRMGDTGYRFVKVEAVACDLILKNVQGIFVHRDIDYKGSFECDDEVINRIWQVGAYTVFLNMQDYLWDGIKRDRLVWLGDMHPETLTVMSVFGHDPVVPKSLDFAAATTPPGRWINGIPSYTCWWVINQRDWYNQNGDFDYLARQRDFLYRALGEVLDCLSDDGELHYTDYFCDWSSRGGPDEQTGAYAVTLMGLRAGEELCRLLGNAELADRCRRGIDCLMTHRRAVVENKQVGALSVLAGSADARQTAESLLLPGGAHGMSTFFGCYVLRALAAGGHTADAIHMLKDYWGGMLKLGATTFWEDFDLDWITDNTVGVDQVVPPDKIDVHGDFGKHCYQQFRHSLCHGWASGPTSFLSQVVAGIEILEPGCKKVRVRPQLGDLHYIKVDYPTPYGLIHIESDATGTRVQVPQGVELVD